MCLSIPGKVIEIQGDNAKTSIGGSIVEVSLQLLDEVQVGDYVLVHAGFALEKINPEEAEATLRLLEEMDEEESQNLRGRKGEGARGRMGDGTM